MLVRCWDHCSSSGSVGSRQSAIAGVDPTICPLGNSDPSSPDKGLRRGPSLRAFSGLGSTLSLQDARTPLAGSNAARPGEDSCTQFIECTLFPDNAGFKAREARSERVCASSSRGTSQFSATIPNLCLNGATTSIRTKNLPQPSPIITTYHQQPNSRCRGLYLALLHL